MGLGIEKNSRPEEEIIPLSVFVHPPSDPVCRPGRLTGHERWGVFVGVLFEIFGGAQQLAAGAGAFLF